MKKNADEKEFTCQNCGDMFENRNIFIQVRFSHLWKRTLKSKNLIRSEQQKKNRHLKKSIIFVLSSKN